MPKVKLIILLLGFLLIAIFAPKVQAIDLCSYQGMTTTSNIRNQMSYPDENFIGLTIASLGQMRNLSQLKSLTCLQYMDFYKTDIKLVKYFWVLGKRFGQRLAIIYIR